MSQIHCAVPLAPAGAVGMEIVGAWSEPPLVPAWLPNGTGVPDIASGYDEPGPPAARGAF